MHYESDLASARREGRGWGKAPGLACSDAGVVVETPSRIHVSCSNEGKVPKRREPAKHSLYCRRGLLSEDSREGTQDRILTERLRDRGQGVSPHVALEGSVYRTRVFCKKVHRIRGGLDSPSSRLQAR